jgi:hypothetical protein
MVEFDIILTCFGCGSTGKLSFKDLVITTPQLQDRYSFWTFGLLLNVHLNYLNLNRQPKIGYINIICTDILDVMHFVFMGRIMI